MVCVSFSCYLFHHHPSSNAVAVSVKIIFDSPFFPSLLMITKNKRKVKNFAEQAGK